MQYFCDLENRKENKIVEVKYAGTHENADYERICWIHLLGKRMAKRLAKALRTEYKIFLYMNGGQALYAYWRFIICHIS